MRTLKPCPFCGSECELNELLPQNPGARFAVACRECHAIGPWNGIAYLAEDSWNARTTENRQLTALDCLLRLVQRVGFCPNGEKRCEVEMAEEALKEAGWI